MRRTTLVLALVSVLLGAGWLLAADKPIVGTWDCISTSPDGNEMHFTMKVKEDAGKLAAVAIFEGGEIQLADPKFDNGTFTFKATLDSGTYEVEMKLSGDKLDGTYKGTDANGPVKGSRNKA